MAATSVFTEHFHFSMLWHFPLCLMHVFIWIYCDITSVLIFRSTFILSLISGDAAYIQKCPLKFVHCWTFFLLFSSAQFQIVSTATVKVLLSDLLCLCTNLGYAVYIFVLLMQNMCFMSVNANHFYKCNSCIMTSS